MPSQHAAMKMQGWTDKLEGEAAQLRSAQSLQGNPMFYRMKMTVLLAAMAVATAAMAQAPDAKPTRIRGAIVSLNGDTLMVHRNSGDTVPVSLPANVTLGAVKRIKLSDIKPGSFIGTAATTGVDGKMTATEVHVFDESARGTGEGHRAFDLGPNSTMTNANVDSVVKSTNGNVLQLSYKGGTNTVTVPADVPVVAFIAADRSDLTAGKKVIVTAAPGAGGAFTAQRILVEKNGVAPPM
jgi:hypothetical protein